MSLQKSNRNTVSFDNLPFAFASGGLYILLIALQFNPTNTNLIDPLWQAALILIMVEVVVHLLYLQEITVIGSIFRFVINMLVVLLLYKIAVSMFNVDLSVLYEF